MERLLAISSVNGWKHFLCGGTVDLIADLFEHIYQRFQGAEIVGSHSLPFREQTEQDKKETISRIKKTGAEIVWVEISSIRQESWKKYNVAHLDAPVLIWCKSRV